MSLELNFWLLEGEIPELKMWWDLGRMGKKLGRELLLPLGKAENKICSEGEGWL